MTYPSLLSASTILRENIRQDVSLVFLADKRKFHSYQRVKKWFYLLASLFSFCSFLPSSGYAAEMNVQDFIVTAYYSPLPDQQYYVKGNFEAEKRLNGNGIIGASGTPVFTGMLAAPKGYAFGTRILFQGLGLGVVEDRGGAIVQAGERGYEHDRIDIWMGHGEAGLRRAMIWGKRTVRGVVQSATGELFSGPYIDLEGIDTGRVDLSLFPSTNGSSGPNLSEAVKMFQALGYTTSDRLDASYIRDFQLDYHVISSVQEEGAGMYGPKTKAALLKTYARYSSIREAELRSIEEQKEILLAERATFERSYIRAEAFVLSLGSPERGQVTSQVETLQKYLKKLGHFRGNPSGKMTPSTILALKKFQKQSGLTPTGKLDFLTQTALMDVYMTGITL